MAPIVARDTTQLLPMFLNTAALLGTCCARPCFSLIAQTAAAVLHAGDTPSGNAASATLIPRLYRRCYTSISLEGRTRNGFCGHCSASRRGIACTWSEGTEPL